MTNANTQDIGDKIYSLAQELFPICRSLTGDGVRMTLSTISKFLPEIKVHEVPTGTCCGDWNVPDEWNIYNAYILDPDGRKIIDFNHNNLHVMGYSEPVNKMLTLEQLLPHLHSDPVRPDAIPYRTSYYQRRWGFCLTHKQLQSMKPGNYRVFIDSTLKPGHMTYGELLFPGKTEEEVLISTYICHPSMANNELSGIVVTTYIAMWLQSCQSLNKTYRILFVPETLGAICYLNNNIDAMKKNIIAGFNLTCIGDNRSYSYLQSRSGNTLADKVANHVLKNTVQDYVVYPFVKSGSDERQYCSPGVDLPFVSLMRTKYNEYPEYHSSLDNLDVISPGGLEGGYNYVKRCIECIEYNRQLQLTTLGLPQLGKRELYPTLSTATLDTWHRRMVDLMSYADGADLLTIADVLEVPMWELFDIVKRLKREGVLQVV